MKTYPIHMIANILSVNYQKLNKVGLIEGHLGIALFFYRFARELKRESCVQLADGIIDYTFDNYLKSVDRVFSFGLFGFGWSLCKFAAEGFIEVDNSTLADFKALVESKYSIMDIESDLKSGMPVYSQGLFCAALKDEQLSAKALSDLERDVFPYVREHAVKTCYLISILYFLKQYGAMYGESDTLMRLKTEVVQWIGRSIEGGLSTSQDLYILKAWGVNYSHESYEPDVLNDVYMNWQTIVYEDALPQGPTLSDDSLSKYFYSIQVDVKPHELSLNGMANVGLHLINDYKNSKITVP